MTVANATNLTLLRRCLDGCDTSKRQLVESSWPVWRKQVQTSRALRAVQGTEDDVTNVLLRVLEKLLQPEGRALRLYPDWQERHPDKSFDDWTRILVANCLRDYLRTRNKPLDHSRSLDELISPKRLLNEYTQSSWRQSLSNRPPFTAKETARRLLEYAKQELKPHQWQALALWLEGHPFDEIAASLGCDEAQAKRSLRAGLAHLRRTFDAT